MNETIKDNHLTMEFTIKPNIPKWAKLKPIIKKAVQTEAPPDNKTNDTIVTQRTYEDFSSFEMVSFTSSMMNT